MVGAALALGVAQSLWALFQWAQLWVVEAGGQPSCGLSGDASCAAVWSAPFAVAVERASGLPLAGWGLAWGIVATVWPGWTLVGRAEGRPGSLPWTAAQMTAVAGAVAVCVLAAASAWIGTLCTTCAGTYALVLGYAAVCLLPRSSSPGGGRLRGVLLAGGAALGVFVAMVGARVLLGSRAEPSPALRAGEAPGDLGSLVATLSPEQRRALGQAVRLWSSTPDVPSRPPRALLGSDDAPVRVTEFSDVLCGHCAGLHHTLALLRETLPPGSFTLESRQFPLDASCNPAVQRRSEAGPVRCLAARVRICLEDRPEEAFQLSGRLFAEQEHLTDERVYALASGYLPRAEIEACVLDPATDTKLRGDIAWAVEHEIPGTPLVLVNGRKAPASPGLLYALILAGGDPADPALRALEAPEP